MRSFTTTLLRVTVLEGKNLGDGGGGRLGVEAAQSSVLFGRKRKGDAGMERTEAAEGAAWLRWRKVARKKHKKKKTEKKERVDEDSGERRIKK